VELPRDRIIDGSSITHLLAGRFEDVDPEKRYFYYIRTHLQAVRRSRWKLILPRPEHPLWLAPFSPNTHIAPWDDVGVEKPILYDLERDIGEHRDVAEAHPAVVKALLQLADEARSEIGDYDRIGSGARFYDLGPRRPEVEQWRE
jgi:hypothetical protein